LFRPWNSNGTGLAVQRKGSYFGIEVADGGPVKADEDSFQDWAWARGWCSTGSPPGCGAS